MRTKVKVIVEGDAQSFEESLNLFLQTQGIEIIDIKYTMDRQHYGQSCYAYDIDTFSAMVLYSETGDEG